ncbi:hypothetical protein EV363DRAFT_1247813 [Boletus edulis]|nr:hypothetical protein EV363DRAFT_1247813 [Boletus edulis]
MDEMCITYASQTARGRSQSHEPKTYSICLRKVYPHEVTDYLLGKGWRTRQTNDIPLPPEGQPMQERYPDDSESSTKPDEDETRYWERGWYIWTTSSNKNALEKLQLMSSKSQIPGPLSSGQTPEREEWAEWTNMDRTTSRANQSRTGRHAKFRTASGLPTVSLVDTGKIHLSPKSLHRSAHSLTHCVGFIAPTAKVLDIFRRSFESGSQREFARRVLEKGHSQEPFILARRLCKKAWEMIAGPPDAKSDI